MESLDWTPCRDDPELWTQHTASAEARAACLRCPVRRRCAAQALTSYQPIGTWAGVHLSTTQTPVERRDALALLRKIAAP